MMKITTSGTASPGLGGFMQITSSKLLGTFYHVIVAKIPVGYTLNQYNNAVGTGETFTWLTPRAGTGKFETYIYKLDCGTAGSFSSFGHVALTGPAATSSNPVTWYVAYSTVLDATAGTKLNTDVNFASGMNGMETYNNAGNGTTSLSRIARSSDSPLTGASYMVRVTNTGSAHPGLGGFYQLTSVPGYQILLLHNLVKNNLIPQHIEFAPQQPQRPCRQSGHPAHQPNANHDHFLVQMHVQIITLPVCQHAPNGWRQN